MINLSQLKLLQGTNLIDIYTKGRFQFHPGIEQSI